MEVTQAVLDFMRGVLKNHSYLVLTPREHVMAILKPTIRRTDGWVAESDVIDEFERYGAHGVFAKETLAILHKEGVIERRSVSDQGATFHYFRRALRPARA